MFALRANRNRDRVRCDLRRRSRQLESLESRRLLAADVVINEIMADNATGIVDRRGDHIDWIELFNRGDESISLEGWKLRDSGNSWTFPALDLEAGAYLMVFASGRDEVADTEIHTNFRLSRGGEFLALTKPDGTVVTELNPFPPQQTDVSYGLASDGSFLQYFAVPTPGAENPPAPVVVINEIQSSNQGTLADEDGDFADWLELFNAGTVPVNLKGWTVSDSSFEWTFPEVTMDAGGYLVVFASGNDRSDVDGELHTSFKLSSHGENIVLSRPDNTTADAIRFPPQPSDASYGRTIDFAELFEVFRHPTPGEANATGYTGVRYNIPSGYYEQSFTVELGTELPDSQIYYTMDGSMPSRENGLIYSDPISITTTTVLRSVAYREDTPPIVTSSTYVFPRHVGDQTGEGLPDTWGFVADYAMDPEVNNIDSVTVDYALTWLPSVSIALDSDDLFSIEDGLFAHPMMEGPEWQRPASIEMLRFNNRVPIRLTGQLEITGTAADRNPAITPKFSLNVSFDEPFSPDDIGDGLLINADQKRYSGFVLRGGIEDSWLATDPLRHDQATFVRNRWMRESQQAMGQPVLDSQFVHVYLNGLYWGVYELTQQPNAFSVAENLGGVADDYDVIIDDAVVDGNDSAWKALLAKASEDLSDDRVYDEIAGLIDIDSLIDFAILKRYAGVDDRGAGKWFAFQQRSSSDGFKFVHLTNDLTLGLSDPANANLPDSTPERLFQQLQINQQFRRRFADRVQLHTRLHGLTDHLASNAWYRATDELSISLAAEASRWGDYRRDENPLGGAHPLRTLNDWFVATSEAGGYFSGRADAFVEELQEAAMFPATKPPTIALNPSFGGSLEVQLQAESGNIYFTLDGSNVVMPDGSLAENAELYTSSILVRENAILKTRARDGGEWSALVETDLFLASPPPIRVVEMMYHPEAPPEGSPYDDDDFEYLEIKNLGSETVDLRGMKFDLGIDFSFADSTIQSLAPNQTLLLVKNEAAFKSRYDADGLLIAGEYQGQLNNGGEMLQLVDAFDQPIHSFWYSDLWFPITDGEGYSLAAIEAENGDVPIEVQWKSSNFLGGSPGIEEDPLLPGSIVINEVVAQTDDPQGDWVELHNTTANPIDVGGWYLSDSRTRLKRFRIPDNQIIPADGYLVFTEVEDFGNADNPNTLEPFGIRQSGESIYLSSGDSDGKLGGYRESISISASQPNVSIGRYQKIDGTVDYVSLVTRTPNAENSPPKVGPVVINEIYYQPGESGTEYIELLNITNQTVPLYDPLRPAEVWEFREGIDYEFPENITLPPGGYALLVKTDPAIFRERVAVPDGIPVFGPYAGTLRNEGEDIELYQPTSNAGDASSVYYLVDRVDYDNQSPWSFLAAGFDSSLERRVAHEYGNDAANWKASRLRGSAGGANVGVNDAPQSVPVHERFERARLQDLDGWTLTVRDRGEWLLGFNGGDDTHELISRSYDDPCDACGFENYAVNEAILALDVTETKDLALQFKMAAASGEALNIAISGDRLKWHSVTDILGSPEDFRDYAVALGSTIEAANLDGHDTVYLRLSHLSPTWSSDPIRLDEIAVDNIDVIGPWLSDFEYSGSELGSIDRLRLVFSEDINPESFTAEDLVLIDPVGDPVVANSITSADNVTWTITFDPRSIAGDHRFELGPEIVDPSGNTMNMARYTVDGSPPDVATFRGNIQIPPVTVAGYPLEESFEQGDFSQLDGWGFSVDPGGRWSFETDGNPIDGGMHLRAINTEARFTTKRADFTIDLTGQVDNEELELDFWGKRVGSRDSSFGAVYLSNDGENWNFLYGLQPQINRYTHFAIDLRTSMVNASLTLEQPLYVRLEHTSASEGDGMYFDAIRVSNIDAFGPYVVSERMQKAAAPISSYVVSFNEAIDAGSISIDAIHVLSPPGQEITVTSVDAVDDRTFRINFQPRQLAGRYRLVFDATIRDLAGNPMNQDRDPVSGEVSLQDGFTAEVTVGPARPQAFPYRQDFALQSLDSLDGWTFATSGDGEWGFSEGNELDDDSRSLIINALPGRFLVQEASVVLDLADQADSAEIYLDFQARSLSRTSFLQDDANLLVSGDGDRWTFVSRIFLQNDFISHAVDLDQVLKQNHIAIDGDVYVKFQSATRSRGMELDAIRVSRETVIGARVVEQQFATDDGTLRVTVTFDQPMLAESFTPDDAQLRLPGVSIHPARISTQDNRSFELIFDTPGMAGLYDLVVGPQILNEAAVPMNQNQDAWNGFDGSSSFAVTELDDSYIGSILVDAKPQQLPFMQDFESGELVGLSGWVFHTVNQFGTREGGQWNVTEAFDPFDQYHLQATQFSDCWSQHDAIVPIDLSTHRGATDLILEFYLQRTETSPKSADGTRNIPQLLIGGLGGFTQVGDASHLIGLDGVGRFGDLNNDGVTDLVPTYREYVHYRFDLDQLMQEAGVANQDVVLLNLHRLAFYSTDVTTFDDIRVYRSSQVDGAGPTVQGFLVHDRATPENIWDVERVTIEFDEAVYGFAVDDITLTRNGQPVVIPDHVRLLSDNRQTWLLQDLVSATDLPGEYRLSVVGGRAGITDALGNPFEGDLAISWTDTRTAGDANLDGFFNSSDLVRVFQSGEYEDGIEGNSLWSEGDWNGDHEFGTSDLVLAFTAGNYAAGNVAAQLLNTAPDLTVGSPEIRHRANHRDPPKTPQAAVVAKTARPKQMFDQAAIDSLFERTNRRRFEDPLGTQLSAVDRIAGPWVPPSD